MRFLGAEPPGRAGLDIAALREAARTGSAAGRRMLFLPLAVGLGATIVGVIAWAALASASAPTALAPGPRAGTTTGPAGTAMPTPTGMPRPSLGAPLLPDGPSSITGGPAAPQGRADWVMVLSALDTNRSRAFAIGSLATLGHVYAQGSTILNDDRRRLRALRSAGFFARGLRPSLAAVRLIRAEPGIIVLEVRDLLLPYTIVDHAGDAIEHRPGRGAQTWQVSLVPSPRWPGQWLISSIRPAS